MKNMTSEDLNRWIGSRIYTERTVQKMSQEALAQAADVSRVFISRLENGNDAARIDTYYRIACALNISLCELFRGNENSEALDGILLLLSDHTDDEIRAYTDLLRIVKNRFSPLQK